MNFFFQGFFFNKVWITFVLNSFLEFIFNYFSCRKRKWLFSKVFHRNDWIFSVFLFFVYSAFLFTSFFHVSPKKKVKNETNVANIKVSDCVDYRAPSHWSHNIQNTSQEDLSKFISHSLGWNQCLKMASWENF